MLFGGLDEIKDEVSEINEVCTNQRRTWSFTNLGEFFGWMGVTFKTIFNEPGIIIFAMGQVVAISITYYIWVQFLGWIPEEVWRSEEELQNIGLNLALIAWSFLCVGIASGPVALFTGCIGASHFLKKQGFPSGISACMRMVLPRIWSLWFFYWIDGWITVNQILERLPKKDHYENPAVKAAKELLYYAWKLATTGILPSILNGKNLMMAGKESILMIKNEPQAVMLLRGGYSLMCWIVGILTYVGTIAMFVVFPNLINVEEGNFIYKFYSWVGIPIILSVTVIQLFLRPIFILGSCEIYSEYVITENIKESYKKKPGVIYSAFIAFGLLLFTALGIFLYREPLGLNAILELRDQRSTPVEQRVDSGWSEDAPAGWNEPESANDELPVGWSDAYDSEPTPVEPEPVAPPEKKSSSGLGSMASSMVAAAKCANPTIKIEGDIITETCE